ncbi:hypothetical protein POJ06DRAFT_258457 [Lipomyces tetrasporus]|uniref:HNH nuclease domain-containing protein n=1 Tax=Lipomyces tetrasporus TaxID=54092 RepID=A0AAD7QPK0_9ASCO|nr:uncharacterized protein POJ06DRAFT_258457 [Lipomyces tetrasporus]KAJ8098973.1 hypothetical protein POJ06DRAFT_258457 [Lipomyces tetrasporus]
MTELDDSEKTLPETLVTILEPCEVSLAFDYHNRTIDVRPIATALLQWGYDRDSLAGDLWQRITDSRQKIEILKKLLRPCDARALLPSPESGFVPRRARTWQEVRSKFLQSDDLRASVISWTRDFYLDLLLTIMAPSRTPTPSDRSTSTRNQQVFRRKLFDRDGVVSLIGKVLDRRSYPAPPGMSYFSTSILQGAHIIHFSANSHPELRKVLSIFAGQSVEMLLTGSQINDPSNGLLLDVLTHELFGSFRFGIECRDKTYRLRKLYPDIGLSEQLARHNDGEELLFGWKSHLVPPPSSLLCNVHLAICHVLRESNAFPMILAILEDEEEFNSGNTDGDYWLVAGASYLERKLRGLAASSYSDTDGLDEDERLVKDDHVITAR